MLSSVLSSSLWWVPDSAGEAASLLASQTNLPMPVPSTPSWRTISPSVNHVPLSQPHASLEVPLPKCTAFTPEMSQLLPKASMEWLRWIYNFHCIVLWYLCADGETDWRKVFINILKYKVQVLLSPSLETAHRQCNLYSTVQPYSGTT